MLAAVSTCALYWGSENLRRAKQRTATESEPKAQAIAETGPDRIPVTWEEPGPPFEKPVVVTGRVLDAYGQPVFRAEVSVVAPRPYRVTFSQSDGRYELTFPRPGKYLLEGRLTLDMARERKTIEIPATGVVPRVDFHLQAAGVIFGEIVAAGAPVASASVDIGVVDLYGDVDWELDTQVENGFFSFAFAPPANVPLRLVVRGSDVYMEKPLELTYTGERLDLGRLTLTRYPSLLLKLRLPDGSYAREVFSAPAALLRPQQTDSDGDVLDDGLPDVHGAGSRYVLREKRDVTKRLALWATTTKNVTVLVVRDIHLVNDQLTSHETAVAPGPFTVRRRLVDENGEALMARLSIRGVSMETSQDGYFSVSVPHGGMFTAQIRALALRELGWVALPAAGGRAHAAVLVNADQPDDVVFSLARRVLMVGRPPFAAVLRRATGNASHAWGFHVDDEARVENVVGALSPPLTPGRYAYRSGILRMRSVAGLTKLAWDFDVAPKGWVEITESNLQVVDQR